jgi:hypothetical protein
MEDAREGKWPPELGSQGVVKGCGQKVRLELE